MLTPIFINHITASAMKSSSHPASRATSKHVDTEVQSISRPRSNSLPALAQRFKSTLSLSRRRSGSPNSSSSSLLSEPSGPSNSQPKSPTTAFSDSFPRTSRMSLRSLFRPRRKTAPGSVNSSETEEESMDDHSPLLPSPPRRKSLHMFSPDGSDGGLYFGFYDEPSQYPDAGPIREEEPLSPDTRLPALEFDDDEDTSEPEEDDMSMMQEFVLGRIEFRM